MKKRLCAYIIPVTIIIFSLFFLNSQTSSAANYLPELSQPDRILSSNQTDMLGDTGISLESLYTVIIASTISALGTSGMFLLGAGSDGNMWHPWNFITNGFDASTLICISALSISALATNGSNPALIYALSAFLLINAPMAYAMAKNISYEAWRTGRKYTGVIGPKLIWVSSVQENDEEGQQMSSKDEIVLTLDVPKWVLAPDGRLEAFIMIHKLVTKFCLKKGEERPNLSRIFPELLDEDLEKEFFVLEKTKKLTDELEEKGDEESHKVRDLRRNLTRRYHQFLLSKIGFNELSVRLAAREDELDQAKNEAAADASKIRSLFRRGNLWIGQKAKESFFCKKADDSEAEKILRKRLVDNAPVMRQIFAFGAGAISLIVFGIGTNGLYTSIKGIEGGGL